jgi:hypothetical protein
MVQIIYLSKMDQYYYILYHQAAQHIFLIIPRSHGRLSARPFRLA